MDHLDYQLKLVEIKNIRDFLDGRTFSMWSSSPNILHVQVGNFISKFYFPSNKVILTDHFFKLVRAVFILPESQVITQVGDFVKAEYLPHGFMVSAKDNLNYDFEIISMRKPQQC